MEKKDKTQNTPIIQMGIVSVIMVLLFFLVPKEPIIIKNTYYNDFSIIYSLFSLILYIAYFVISSKAVSKEHLIKITGIAFSYFIIRFLFSVLFNYVILGVSFSILLGIENSRRNNLLGTLFPVIILGVIWVYRNNNLSTMESVFQEKSISYATKGKPMGLEVDNLSTAPSQQVQPKSFTPTVTSTFFQKIPPRSPKNSGVAAILNFLIPGAGYIYGDQFNLGITVLLGYAVGIPLITILFAISGVMFLLILSLLIYVFAFGFYIFQIFDVYNYLSKFEVQQPMGYPQYPPVQQNTPIQQTIDPLPSQNPSMADQFREYKQLLEEGVITEEEFIAMKKKLIEEN